jgi:hypothetical protein
MNKQKKVLLILVVVLLTSLIYSYFRMPAQKSAAKLTYAPGAAKLQIMDKAATGKSVNNPVQEKNQLLVALLDQQNTQFKGFKRNLFKPIFREEVKISPLPPPPPAPPQKSILPSKVVTVSPTTTPVTVSSTETAKQDFGRLRFLGFLRKDTRKTIFLAEGAEIFLVRKGDKISGRYQVTGLTDDAITITVLADKSDLVFPLMENRALSVGNR